MILPINLEINLDEAIEYYNTLTENYQHLHWYYTKDHNEPSMIAAKNNLGKMHGWGLQTIYNDLTFPYHGDLDPHDEGPTYFKDTELVFGWSKKIMSLLKQPYRSFLLVYPSGDYLGPYDSTPPPHFRLYIPIISNDNAWLINSNTKEKYLLKPGVVYLNTFKNFTELRNDGDSDMVYMEVNSPICYLSEILEKYA